MQFILDSGKDCPVSKQDMNYGQKKDHIYFLYSYRVIHHRDPVPHIPPRLGPDEVFHHRFEVWYNNDMAVGQPYTICKEADGDYCSNQVISVEGSEHMWYFNRNIGEWGVNGCPS
ncbi:unnamed protein product [Heligmosomoides polygyrus]|uniref:Neprosin domain-containing protein n=1 Tax=Heligmosomoides polygyrus TaxID=6339 RepID=A0A183F701_HELPZ|nr:unnamed protein product [Heligmosomoides polygyrus]